MKVTNLDTNRAVDTTRGRTSPRNAGSRGITFRDATTEAHPVRDLLVVGGVITDNDDGTAVLTIGGAGGGGDPTDPNALQSSGGELHVTYVVAASGSALTLDLSVANFFDITLTANCTLTFTNPPPSGSLAQFLIALRQGGSGSYIVTWPASVVWADTDRTPTTSAPALATAVGAQDDVLLSTQDGGGSYGASMDGGSATSSGRWELAVIPGSPPDSLYANGDWLYILV